MSALKASTGSAMIFVGILHRTFVKTCWIQ